MHLLLSILIFAILSFVAMGEQGTYSTDNTQASQAPASLSGYEDNTRQSEEIQEEEVRIDDDDYVEKNNKKVYDPEKVQKDEEQYPSVNPDTQ